MVDNKDLPRNSIVRFTPTLLSALVLIAIVVIVILTTFVFYGIDHPNGSTPTDTSMQLVLKEGS